MKLLTSSYFTKKIEVPSPFGLISIGNRFVNLLLLIVEYDENLKNSKITSTEFGHQLFPDLICQRLTMINLNQWKMFPENDFFSSTLKQHLSFCLSSLIELIIIMRDEGLGGGGGVIAWIYMSMAF